MKQLFAAALILSTSISTFAATYNCRAVDDNSVVELKIQKSSIFGSYIRVSDESDSLDYTIDAVSVTKPEELPRGEFVYSEPIANPLGDLFFGGGLAVLLEKSLIKGETRGVLATANTKTNGEYHISKIFDCQKK